MTKLACRTSIPIKCNQDELASIGHSCHPLLVRWPIVAPDQGRRGQNQALGQSGKPAKERIRCRERCAWNCGDGDTERSAML
jgi:hypothetical protein